MSVKVLEHEFSTDEVFQSEMDATGWRCKRCGLFARTYDQDMKDDDTKIADGVTEKCTGHE